MTSTYLGTCSALHKHLLLRWMALYLVSFQKAEHLAPIHQVDTHALFPWSSLAACSPVFHKRYAEVHLRLRTSQNHKSLCFHYRTIHFQALGHDELDPMNAYMLFLLQSKRKFPSLVLRRYDALFEFFEIGYHLRRIPLLHIMLLHLREIHVAIQYFCDLIIYVHWFRA